MCVTLLYTELDIYITVKIVWPLPSVELFDEGRLPLPLRRISHLQISGRWGGVMAEQGERNSDI